MGAVLDADAGGGNIADDRAVGFDIDAVAGVEIADDFAVDHHFPGANFGSEHGGGANGKLMAVERDGAVHFAVNLQVFRTSELTFDMQAGTQASWIARWRDAGPRGRWCTEGDNGCRRYWGLQRRSRGRLSLRLLFVPHSSSLIGPKDKKRIGPGWEGAMCRYFRRAHGREAMQNFIDLRTQEPARENRSGELELRQD